MAEVLVVHARDADGEAVLGLVDLGVRTGHGGIDRVQLCARLIERGAGRKPPKYLGHAVLASLHHGGRKMVRAGDHVGNNLSVYRVRNRWLEHADNGRRAGAAVAVKAHYFAEDVGIGVQRVAPELVGKHNCAGCVGTIVGRSQQPSQYRAQSHHLEVIPIHDTGWNGARSTEAHYGETDLGECAEMRNGFQVRADVMNFGDGECGIRYADSRRALAKIEQLALIAIGQRTQQHCAHYAEDGRIGADTQGECEGDGDP